MIQMSEDEKEDKGEKGEKIEIKADVAENS